MAEGSWVGLDVHARSVIAGVLDAETGELRSWRAPTLCEETVAWLQQYPAPVRVAYVRHSNEQRPHRALDLQAPDPYTVPSTRSHPAGSASAIRRLDLLGGLIHEYEATAA